MEERKYEIGEHVLCKHRNFWYKAKVIDTFYRYDRVYYVVHYVGWKNVWNESVLCEKLCKDTAENAHLVADTSVHTKKKGGRPRKASNASKAKNNKAKQTGSAKSACETTGRKAMSENAVRKCAERQTRKNVVVRKNKGDKRCQQRQMSNNMRLTSYFDMPENLTDILHDERHWIIDEYWLPSLPASPTVREIVDIFVADNSNGKTVINRPLLHFKSRVIGLFDRILPFRLLRRFERLQFMRMVKSYPRKPFSEIYGYPHIIRLCVKFGELFAEANVKQRDAKRFLPFFRRFLQFLCTHECDWLNMNTYESALPAYVRATYWD